MTIRYITIKEFAEQLGIKPTSLANYKLPEPDAILGDRRGWLQETLDEWNRNRPGQGHRSKKE